MTPTNYRSQSWVNLTDQEALDLGFITPYSAMSTDEDLCEMLSTYLTHTQEYWDNLVGHASETGQAAINTKLEILRTYMHDTWNMDMDAVRAEVLRRQELVGELDLKSLN